MALLVVIALAIAGCGGDDEKDKREGAAEQKTTQSDATKETTKTERSTEADTRPKAGSPPPNTDAHSEGHRAGEPRRVRARLETLFEAVRDDDSREVCSILTRSTRKLIGSAIGQDCKAGMDYAFSLLPEDLDDSIAKIRVTRVKVSGNTATARVRYPREVRAESTLQYFTRSNNLGLKKEGGEWRVPLVAP